MEFWRSPKILRALPNFRLFRKTHLEVRVSRASMFRCQYLTMYVFSKDISASRFTIIHKKILFRDHIRTPPPPTLPPVSRLFSPMTSVPLLMWVTVLFYSFRDENLKMCTVTKLSNFISMCSGTICKLTVDSK